ncbi:MAG TPA: hypothetical protein VMD59_04840 [Acidimicrobiales bacterium]|nr:hypothetical protein [Acidimicrobiales bacterium]
MVALLQAELHELKTVLAERDTPIAELEDLLEQSRRSGKRRAAPFSKAEPSTEPQTPGRKRDDGHGCHGHRMVPPAQSSVSSRRRSPPPARTAAARSSSSAPLSSSTRSTHAEA